MSIINLNKGDNLSATQQNGRIGAPVDARQSVQYYKDIFDSTKYKYPYVYCQVIVREDDPEDTEHPKGIYVITEVDRLGNVVSSGVIPLNQFIGGKLEDITIATTKNQSSVELGRINSEDSTFRIEAGTGIKIDKWPNDSDPIKNAVKIGIDTNVIATKEDTLLKTTQSLTNTEKETVIGNILDKDYIAESYVGKGKKYLKLNVDAPVASSFDGFVDGAITEQSSLADTPDNIYFDRTNNRFIASKGEGLLLKYYMSWLNGEAYMNPNSGVYFKNGDNYYQWNGTTLEAATIRINKLTQADFDSENTIYVIRYDYDLNNQTITIPENCVLEFDGGSFDNGIIVLNNGTEIKAVGKCFGENITINNGGRIEWNVLWFGVKSGEGTVEADWKTAEVPEYDLAPVVQKLIDMSCLNIFIPTGDYFWSKRVICKYNNLRIHGDFIISNPYGQRNNETYPFNNRSIKVGCTVDCMLEVGDGTQSDGWRTLEMFGLCIQCALGFPTTILTGSLGLSRIYNNLIKYCGYFFNNFGKSYKTQSWCTRYNVEYDANANQMYCGLRKTSKVFNNDIRGVGRSCFKCMLGDVEIYENYITGAGFEKWFTSEDQFEWISNKTFFIDQTEWSGMGCTYVHNNYIDFFYMVYNFCGGAQDIFSTNNTYDIASCVFGSYWCVTGAPTDDYMQYLPTTNVHYNSERFVNITTHRVLTKEQFLEIQKFEHRNALDGIRGYFDTDGQSYYRYRYDGKIWEQVNDYLSIQRLSSVGDNFIRINNFEHGAVRGNGSNVNYPASSWEWDSEITKSIAQSTRYHLISACGGEIDPAKPLLMQNSVYYNPDAIYSVLKIIPEELTMVIGGSSNVEYIIYTDKLTLRNSTENFFISGGRKNQFKFDTIQYGQDKNASVFIQVLYNNKVETLPESCLYNGRQVILNGALYVCDNNTWNTVGTYSLPSTANVINPDINKFIEEVVYDLDDQNIKELANDYRKNSPLSRFSTIKQNVGVVENMKDLINVRVVCFDSNHNGTFIYDSNLHDINYIDNMIPGRQHNIEYTYIDNSGNTATTTKLFLPTGKVRLINVDGATNIRDIGGWSCDGGTIKYGIIYRGGNIDSISSDGKFSMINELKIKKEIYLGYYPTYGIKEKLLSGSIPSTTSVNGTLSIKNPAIITEDSVRITDPSIVGTLTANNNVSDIIIKRSVLPEVSYVQWAIGNGYGSVITDTNIKNTTKNAINDIITFIRSNHTQNTTAGLYLHCDTGLDRTGTMCIILLGLLGVSESDILKEFDISIYYNSTVSSFAKAVEFMKLMKTTYSGNSFKDSVEAYLLDCGISQNDIDDFRDVMIDTNIS